jgi:phytoene dehydrogenase-like protein
VVDQHAVAGGSGTVFRRRGYEFDVGLHYLGGCHPDGVLPRVLRGAGVTDVEFEEMDPDGFDTLVFPDFTFRVPKGIDAFRDRLVAAFPEERRGVDRHVALLRQLQRAMRALGRPLAMAGALPRSLTLLRWAGATFGEFLDTCTRAPRLRAVLAGQHGNYALPPSRASLVVGAGIALHYLEGAYYPRGGGQVLSDRLAEAVERHGGTILLLSRVTRILVEAGRVRGVQLESPHLGPVVVSAPVVVSNADLKQTMTTLVGAEHLRPATAARVRRFEMSPGLAVLYLGLRRDLVAEGHPRTNYWVATGYDCETGYAAVRRGEFPAEPVVYVSIASVKDPTNPHLAPAGMTNVQAMAIAPSAPPAWGVRAEDARSGGYRGGPAYQDRKAGYARTILSVAERALPGITGAIAHEEMSTPLTHWRYTGATGGTSYGIALTPDQFLWRRPGPRTEIAGLFLAGASCRSGHGITGAAISGVMAAAQIVGWRLLREVLSGPGPASRRSMPPRTGPAAEPVAASNR